MRQTNKIIAEAVLSAVQKGTPLQRIATSLAALLIEERRTKDADAIIREVERLLANQGSIELKVTTAHGLTERLRQEIVALFKDKANHITVNEKKDPSVLGGVLVESNEERLDLTVRRQLQRLKGVGN
jgi:F-type H+-transporting ATPase subunit delta